MVAILERQIIASAIQNKEAAETLRKLNVLGDLGPEGKRVLGTILEYYETDGNARHIDMDLLRSSVLRGVSNPKHEELFKLYLDRIPPDVSEPNVLKHILELKRERAGQKLAAALATNKSNGEISPLIEAYQGYNEVIVSNPLEGVYTGWNPEDLVRDKFDRANLIKLVPDSLNDRASGGCMPGDHLVIFSCTEIGKTLFAVNLTCGFLSQGLKVLYCGNEEPVARINMRVINNISGGTRQEVESRSGSGTLQEILRKGGYDNFSCKDFHPGTIAEISDVVEALRPDCVVIDQLRNLDTGGDNRVNSLEKAATGARNLAKSKGLLVISLTQAGDSADGKAILGRGDVDYSNVGIPGQADMLIGIGANEEMEGMNMRCISFPKNKNGSHVPFYVTIIPELSRVIETVEES